MSRGYPSMTALLALVAVAGYQNRDKIAEIINGLSDKGGSAAGNAMPGGLGDLLSGKSAGGLLNGGLGELMKQFTESGQKDKVDSWIGKGPNQEIAPPDLKQTLGPDVIQALSRATGLSEQDLLARLSQALPGAVDKYTPDGKIAA